ncbi:Uma2 family endonuclease [Streptomyces sp. NPDC089919]|uniref:Uma2 family endonuclease n=1 Tax=Streptomyces sp. NPDC089919 TaxID=3155188 RepID=UPI003427585E
MERNPGCRVEIIDGQIRLSFLRDGPHQEVTANNFRADLHTKVRAYGNAGIPVYVIVDRRHQRLHVLTEPQADGYETHRVHAPGELVTLPESIGAKVTLDVAEVLRAAAPKPKAE